MNKNQREFKLSFVYEKKMYFWINQSSWNWKKKNETTEQEQSNLEIAEN